MSNFVSYDLAGKFQALLDTQCNKITLVDNMTYGYTDAVTLGHHMLAEYNVVAGDIYTVNEYQQNIGPIYFYAQATGLATHVCLVNTVEEILLYTFEVLSPENVVATKLCTLDAFAIHWYGIIPI